MSKAKALSAEAKYLARSADGLIERATEIADLKNSNYRFIGCDRWTASKVLAVALINGLEEMLLRERRVAADPNIKNAKPFDMAKFARTVCGVPEVNDEPLG